MPYSNTEPSICVESNVPLEQPAIDYYAQHAIARYRGDDLQLIYVTVQDGRATMSMGFTVDRWYPPSQRRDAGGLMADVRRKASALGLEL